MFHDSNAWYTYSGKDNDTVISSRIRIVRNLRSYKFPPVLEKEAALRVYDKIAAAFHALPLGESFHSMKLETVDAIAKKIFEERNILPSDAGRNPASGVIIRDDGIVSATVNIKDHLRLSVFYAGFELEKCFRLGKNTIDTLGEMLDFCAVQDFGYLSSDIMNIGSGVKSSVLCSLPGHVLTERTQEKIDSLLKQNFEVHAYYAQNTKQLLGYLYLISTKSAAGYTDEVQVTALNTIIRKLVDEERELRESLFKKQLWQTQDLIIKAFSLAKNAYLLDVKETIDLLFKIKLGINLGFIEGIGHEACLSLLYQIQTAHIAFLILNGTLQLKEMPPLDELHIERIRALLVQEILKPAELRIKTALKTE
ncbi:MAG: ATP--guanido phosphotransferase [Treponema sp.]